MRVSTPFALAAAGLLLAACAGDTPRKEKKPLSPWTTLYNGKDLSGWEVMFGDPASWRAEGDLLVCAGGDKGGWLSTKEEYGNFELALEFNVPPDGNSGVFLRAPRHPDPAHSGLEIQILDDDAPKHKNIEPWQHTGSVYAIFAPAKPAWKKAGQWNHYRIRCVGSKITVDLNGVRIVDGDLATHEKGRDRPRRGTIGLQNHGSGLSFRNIHLKKLD
jgi:hypothetical protein